MIAAMYRATLSAVSPVGGWRYSVTGVSTLTSASKRSTMDEALAVGARHRRVDLGDDVPRHGEHRRREVDGDAEADEAARIGRGDLEQGDIDRQPAGRQQLRHLLEADRHVVELTAAGEAAHVAADEERPMAVTGRGAPPASRQRRRRDEADELEIGRAGVIASSVASRLRGAAQPVPRKTRLPGLIAARACSALTNFEPRPAAPWLAMSTPIAPGN